MGCIAFMQCGAIHKEIALQAQIQLFMNKSRVLTGNYERLAKIEPFPNLRHQVGIEKGNFISFNHHF